MKENNTKCSRYVDGEIKCIHCTSICVKNGHSYGKQRYRCKVCKKTFVENYHYRACEKSINQQIISFIKESCGIRSIARLLKISYTTLLKRIVMISKEIKKPLISLYKIYELDELCTYVQNKHNRQWIVYSINTHNKEVVDFNVGTRSYKTLRKVVNTLLLSNAEKIYTDKLPAYKFIIPSEFHCVKHCGTNHIERCNLTLRTHLKRLCRRTICFSKSKLVLCACLRIYFWS